MRQGCAKEWELVEAVGIEPTSEKRVTQASTCVAFFFDLAAGPGKKAPDSAASLTHFLGLQHKADRNPRSAKVGAPPAATDQAGGRRVTAV